MTKCLNSRSRALDSEGEAVAAAHAERRDAALQMAIRQRVEERRENPAAARADRVSERDGAAVDVDLRWVEAEFANHGDRLHRERLVQFEEVDVLDLPADLLH